MHQLAGAFAVHEIAHFIGEAIEARAKLEDLAQVAGTTPSELSKFEQPALRAGTSLDTVAQAAAKLSRSIGEARAGNLEKDAFLRALGIDPKTADDSVASLETVVRSLDGVKDKNAAGVASNQLLGRSYAELRPFMHEVVEAGQLAATTTDEEVEKAKALTKEYIDLKFNIEKKVRVMAEQLLPTLHNVIDAFNLTASEAGELTDQGEILATMIKMVTSLGLAAADTFYALGHTIAQVAAAAVAAAHGDFSEAATIWKMGNEDIAKHTAETNARIEKIWHDTAEHVKEIEIKPGGDHDNAAGSASQRAIQAVIDFQKHYPELMAKEQAFTQVINAQAKLRAEIIAEEGKRGELDQRQTMMALSANEEKRLNEENNVIQREIALVKQKGDPTKKAELEAALERNQAAIEANRQLSQQRMATYDLLENEEFKKRIASDVNRVQLENLSEKQKLMQGYAERQSAIDQAERLRLISAEEAARQRELVELKHQAAMGNVEAQGRLQRRQWDEMDMRQKTTLIFGTLQNITAGVANSNRQMFEINKIASLGNAIMNTAEGVTKALAAYPPPLSIAMAGIQLAAGLAQVAAIQSATFGGSTSPPSVGGGSATPTFQAPTVATSSDAPKDPVTIVHFHGSTKDEEDTVRRFMAAMNEASRNGQRFIPG